MKVIHPLGMILLTVITASHAIGQERKEPARNGFPEFNWDRVSVSAHFAHRRGTFARAI